MRQVVLDPERLRALRGDRISLDLLDAGRHRLSPAALRRAFRAEPISVSLALHLASVLNVTLDDLLKKESTT